MNRAEQRSRIILRLLLFSSYSHMLTLKDLPIFVSSRKTNPPAKHILLEPLHQLNKKQYRLSQQNQKPKLPNQYQVRLSHKTILEQPSSFNKIKRRISTAGTSKRFPKDFFKMDHDICEEEKCPKFVFKLVKKQIQNSTHQANFSLRPLLSQEYLLKRQWPDNQNQKTPKFHEAEVDSEKSHEKRKEKSKGKEKQNCKQNKDDSVKDEDTDQDKEINQFLIFEGVPKIQSSPYLSLDALNTREEARAKGGGLKMLRKLKKGQIIRRRMVINRTLSQNQYPETKMLNVRGMRGC